MKKFVAVETLDGKSKFYYQRPDDCPEDHDPTKLADGTLAYKVLLESDDHRKCRKAVQAAFDAEGRDPIEEYLRRIAQDLSEGE